MVLKVQVQRNAKASTVVEVNTHYTLKFLLSTISDEISHMEEVTLKVNKVPPGTRILFGHDSSSIHDSLASHTNKYCLNFLLSFFQMPVLTINKSRLMQLRFSLICGIHLWFFQLKLVGRCF